MYLYLHGFNSSGASAKGKFFCQALAPARIELPSYPPCPNTAIADLRRLIETQLAQLEPEESLILIGSSLGGFYAQFLSRQYLLPLVMINPALQPERTLRPYCGWQTNYYTHEHYYFGEDELAQLADYDIAHPCQPPLPTLVLLDQGDEVIDARFAQQRYTECAEVIVFPGGDHQFRHLDEAVEAIRRFSVKL